MTDKRKKLFIILPKKGEILLKSLAFPEGKFVQYGNKNIAITFILEKSQDIDNYHLDLFSGNDSATIKIKNSIKEQSDVVVKCIIDSDNSPLFEKINKKYDDDSRGLCQELFAILGGVKKILKDFGFKKTLADFSKIIVAAHLGGKKIPSYLYMQYKINEHLAQYDKDDKAKIRFVYFSSLDSPASNEYIHSKFPAYSYPQFVNESTEEQFKMFLEILEKRADNKEIEFSKSVVVKMLINKIILASLPIHIDCSGISQLESQNIDTSQYKNESFGSSKLTEYLSKMRIESTVTGLENFSTIDKKAEKLKELGGKALGLKQCSTCEKFVSRFNEFLEEASKIKQSL